MLKIRLVATWLIALLCVVFLSPFAVAATPKTGAACSPLGRSQIVSGYKFSCLKVKNKAIWVNQGKVTLSKPTSSPSVSVSPIPKPSGTPTSKPISSPQPTRPNPQPSSSPSVTPGSGDAISRQSISFAPPAALIMDQSPYTLVVSSSSGLPVKVSSLNSDVCTISGLVLNLVSTGSCVLTATQSGDPSFAAAPSVSRTIAVTAKPQTISFSPPASLTLDQSPYTLVATSSSGLPVTVSSSTTGVCTVSGLVLNLVAAGTCSLTATQAGNFGYSPAVNVSKVISVATKPQAISFSPPTSLTVDQSPYTLVATSSSGLPVTVSSSTTGVCTVTGLVLNLVSTGSCVLTATQSGGTSSAAAPSVSRTIAVTAKPQTISFSPPASLTLDQSPYTLVATSSSGLPVTVSSSTTGVCTVTGLVLNLVSTGSCVLTATQSGGTSSAAAPSVSRTIAVTAKPQTISFSPPASLTLDQSPYTLVATSSSGLPVTVSSSTTGVCTVSGLVLTLLSAGTCSLVAVQLGSSAYLAAQSISTSIYVTLKSQTISFTPPSTLTMTQSPFTLFATSTSGLTVALTSNSPSTCKVTGFTLTLVATGVCTISANQPGNSVTAPASSVLAAISLDAGSQAPTLVSASSPVGLTASMTGVIPCSRNSNCYLGDWAGSPKPTVSVNWYACIGALNDSCANLGAGFTYPYYSNGVMKGYDYWALARGSTTQDTILSKYQGMIYYFVITATNSAGSSSYTNSAGTVPYSLGTFPGGLPTLSSTPPKVGDTLFGNGGFTAYTNSALTQTHSILKCQSPTAAGQSYFGAVPQNCSVVASRQSFPLLDALSPYPAYTLTAGDLGFYFVAMITGVQWGVTFNVWSSTSGPVAAP